MTPNESKQVCEFHGDLTAAISRIDERTKIIQEQQGAIIENINRLTINGAIEKTKIKPIYWIITTIAAATIATVVGMLVRTI